MANERADIGEYLDRIREAYADTFDLEEGVTEGGEELLLYGYFDSRQQRYVLTRRATLWEAISREHLAVISGRGGDMMGALRRLVEEHIEPERVRRGERWPEKDHQQSIITVVIIYDGEVPTELVREIEGYRLNKSYCLGIRGYLETRVIAVGLKGGEVVTNRAGRACAKLYKRLL